MDTTRMTRSGRDAEVIGSLYVAFELGDRSLKLCLGDGVRSPSRCTMSAGDTEAILKAIARANTRCICPMVLRFEAATKADVMASGCIDWSAQGIFNLVVDPPSIEVSRRARFIAFVGEPHGM